MVRCRVVYVFFNFIYIEYLLNKHTLLYTSPIKSMLKTKKATNKHQSKKKHANENE